MYQSPIPPNKDRQCYECVSYHYDSFHDESWCNNNNSELVGRFIDGCGTCELFYSWKQAEKDKIKQRFLFDV